MSRLSVRSLRSDSVPPHSSGRQPLPLPLRLSHHGFSLSLPGMLISARQGSREVITSHSLERYLCPAGPAAASARSRSHLLQFSWLVGLLTPFPSPFPSRSTRTVPCRSYDSLSSLSLEGGGAAERSCSGPRAVSCAAQRWRSWLPDTWCCSGSLTSGRRSSTEPLGVKPYLLRCLQLT